MGGQLRASSAHHSIIVLRGLREGPHLDSHYSERRQPLGQPMEVFFQSRVRASLSWAGKKSSEITPLGAGLSGPLNPSEPCYWDFWKGFRRPSYGPPWCWQTLISRKATPLIVVVFLDWVPRKMELPVYVYVYLYIYNIYIYFEVWIYIIFGYRQQFQNYALYIILLRFFSKVCSIFSDYLEFIMHNFFYW